MSYKINPNEIAGDEMDEAGASIKKENVLERLNKRNKDRQNYLDIKLEQRNKENVQLEGTEFFSHSFAERVREIESRLKDIDEMAAANKRKNSANSDLARLFAGITVEIQELQRYLTSSTMFLTDYKIKACQNVLNELTSTSDDTHLRLVPKKKFGFSGKKTTQKPLVNPKLLADALAATLVGEPHATAATTPAFTWTLADRRGEHIRLCAAEVNGVDVTVSNVQDCVVELPGHAGSLQLTNVHNSTFLCGPIARSVFAEHCSETTFVLACQQLRLHSSAKCRLFLHVTCRAIIEDCTEIDVGKYNYQYDGIDADFVEAKLDRTQNNYTDIADFNWLSPDVPSPNWQLLADVNAADWQAQLKRFQDVA